MKYENEVQQRHALSKFAHKILFELLAGKPATLRSDGGLRLANIIAPATIVDTLLSQDLVVKRGQTLAINNVGRAYINRMNYLDSNSEKKINNTNSAYAIQHRLKQDAALNNKEKHRKYESSIGETPLGWLVKRKGKNGENLISQEQFLAGERLRKDFILSGTSPHITMNYNAIVMDKMAHKYDSNLNAIDRSIGAKKRLDRALDAAGPGLNDILLRVCCDLDGLESAEKKLGWPARSGKVVLSIALDRLIYHYNNQIG